MGSKIAILHWLEEWPLQKSVRTNVLHCDNNNNNNKDTYNAQIRLSRNAQMH